MPEHFKIFVINPGSTSTKIALYKGKKNIFTETIAHDPGELARFEAIADQKDFRKKIILERLKKRSVKLGDLDIIVARGGLTKPVAGGIYRINKKMLLDVRNVKLYGREHASSLASLIAFDLSEVAGVPAVTRDPVATDEMEPIARISGFPGIKRLSLFHALNVKAVGRKARASLGKKKANLVIVHMGGGISVASYKSGEVIDVNNAVLGMGPFTPQRTGALPTADLLNLCYSGKFTGNQLLKKMAKKSGLIGYLGTDDLVEIEKRIKSGDKKAALVYEAMAYQIAKEIGAYATVFHGKIDAVVFTGGMARSRKLIGTLKKRVSFLGRILVFPGEEEQEALALAGLAVLQKKVKPKTYK